MTIGTNSSGHFFDKSFTTDGVLYSAASGVITSTSAGTAGQVLTSNGAGVAPTYQAASAAGAVMQINGDTGSATPAAGVITLNANSNAGKTVLFAASGSTVDLKTTDASGNIIIGALSGSGTISGLSNNAIGTQVLTALTSGSRNNGLGLQALENLTSGSDNTAIGNIALQQLTTSSQNTAIGSNALGTNVTGSNNIAIGYTSGIAYLTSESSNITIGNNGTVGESNVIRIGAQGSGAAQQNKCFIAGITGVTVSNTAVVSLDTTTGQLGDIAGAANSVLTSTGAGNASFSSTPRIAGLGIGAASTGSGLTFDGSNTLANYVQSTFTPVLAFGGGSTGITYTLQKGIYTRIGNTVSFKIHITLSNKGSSTGAATISGLPVTPANDGATQDVFCALVGTSFPASVTVSAGEIVPASTTLNINGFGSSTATNFTDTNFTNTSQIRMSGTYFV